MIETCPPPTLCCTAPQWPRYYRVFNSLYWATFHPLRLILFPVLVPLFYWEMQVGDGG